MKEIKIRKNLVVIVMDDYVTQFVYNVKRDTLSKQRRIPWCDCNGILGFTYKDPEYVTFGYDNTIQMLEPFVTEKELSIFASMIFKLVI